MKTSLFTKTKRILSLVLCLCLVWTMVPGQTLGVYAAEGNAVAWQDANNDGIQNEGELTFTSISAALAAGGTIRLLQNVKTEEVISMDSGTAILDLNGYSIEYEYVEINGIENTAFSISGTADLTVTDSQGGGSIYFCKNNAARTQILLDGSAKFTFAGGIMNTYGENTATYYGVSVSAAGSSQFQIIGGTFTTKSLLKYVDRENYVVTEDEDNSYTVRPRSGSDAAAWQDTDGDGVIDDDEQRFNDVRQAMAAGGNLKLNKNCNVVDTDSTRLEVMKDTTLDLNGYAVVASKARAIYVMSGNLTIRDSHGGGYVEGYSNLDSILVQTGGRCQIEGGTIYGKFAASTDQIFLTGGKYNFDPSAYTAAGYAAVEGNNGLWEVIAINDSTCTVTLNHASVKANGTYTLQAAVSPEAMQSKPVTYTLKEAGTTGAALRNQDLTVPYGGTVTVSVTVDGTYTKDFDINVIQTAVTGISGSLPATADMGALNLPAAVTPADATYNQIEWSVVKGSAEFSSGMVILKSSGEVILRATVKNGLGNGKDYTKDYTITVNTVESLSVADGVITIEQTGSEHKVTYGNSLSVSYPLDKTIAITGTTTSNRIIVKSGSPKLLLNDVSIELSEDRNENKVAMELAANASATLTLAGTNKLVGECGIAVPEGASLAINGTGSLTAQSIQEKNAGIGGADGKSCGTVNITDGTIISIGGKFAAGIGGGYGGSGGTITISGGTVTATGGAYAAGIGGGDEGSGGAITISGGTVTATGTGNEYYSGAGIGGGNGGESGGTIQISGGTIKATGGSWSAGIGGGVDGEGGTIQISGGTINATGGDRAAGIGGGGSGKSGMITIEGGVIAATGGAWGSGIGNGSGSRISDTITISGGSITATAGENGAGIGGGGGGSAGIINISGGTITAKGGDNGAGIGGGGYDGGGSGGTVTITGGNIHAVPGKNAEDIGKGLLSLTSAGTTSGTIKDENGNSLTLQTLTLSESTEGTAVTELTGVTYGLKDVNTLDTNKLYLWVPENSAVSAVTAGGNEYTCKANLTYHVAHDWSNLDGVCANECGLTCDHGGETYDTCEVCGKSSHTHSWNYTVAGNTINAVCTAANCKFTDGNGGSVSIAAPADPTYIGSAIEANVTNSLKTGDTITVDYSGDLTEGYPVNTGDYTASITLGGKTISAEYTINPASIADAVVTAEPSEMTYSGQEQKPDVTVTLGGKILTGGTDYTVSYSDNINAGTAKAAVTGKGNYTGTADAAFTIGKASLTGVSVSQNGTLTYDGGKALMPAVTTAADAVNNQTVTFTYSLAEDGTYGSLPSFTEGGAYTVYYKAEADNHEDFKGRFEVRVAASGNAWTTVPSMEGWTYGEAAKVPSAEAAFGEVKVTYTGTGYSSETAPTEAGRYKAVFTVDETDNYTGLSEEVEFTIAKADASCEAPAAKWQDYSGVPQNLVDAGQAAGGEMQYAVGTDAETVPADGWSTAVPQGTNAGIYYVWYKAAGDGNHNDTEPACVESEIYKGQLEVTAASYLLAVGNAVPDLNAEGAYTITGFVNGETDAVITGKPVLTFEEEPDMSRTGYYWISIDTEAMHAANYEIYGSSGELCIVNCVHAFEDYRLGSVNSENDSIFVKCSNGCSEYGASGAVITIVAPENAVYTQGEWHTASLGYDSQIELSSEDIIYSADPIDAGIYTASITYEGLTASVTYEVAKRPLTIKAADKSVYVNESAPAYTCTVTGWDSGHDDADPYCHQLSGVTAVCGTADLSQAGTYAITISGTPVVKDSDGNDVSSNYTFTTVNGTLTVSRRSSSGGYVPTVQKPVIEAEEGASVQLSKDGKSADITVAEGYDLEDVLVNGKSQGKVTVLTGLKTGDKVEVITRFMETPSEEPEPGSAASAVQLVARSKMSTLNGKRAIQIFWYDENGAKLDDIFDGYEVKRSTMRYSGYGKEPYFETTKTSYKNNKELKAGNTYYYKVRGYVEIDGVRYYSEWSRKAWRTIKK